jgi:hypothetical protein
MARGHVRAEHISEPTKIRVLVNSGLSSYSRITKVEAGLVALYDE